MKRTFLATMACLALAVGAGNAADLTGPIPAMPTKAPQDFFANPGMYWGIEAGAGVQQSSTASGTLFANSLVSGKLTADGGTVGGVFGYTWGNVTQWYAVQASLDYQNISTSQTVASQPVGVASRWSGMVEVRIGGSTLANLNTALANLGISGLSFFPTFTPVAPGGVNVGGVAARSYIAGGFEVVGLSGSVGTVTGANVGVGPMLGVGALWPVFTAAGVATGGAVSVEADVTWLMRGFSIDNLGGTSGGPMFSGGVDTGTRYQIKIAYLFGTKL